MSRHTRTFSFPSHSSYAPSTPTDADADADAESLLPHPRPSSSTDSDVAPTSHEKSSFSHRRNGTSRWLTSTPILLFSLLLSHAAILLAGLLLGRHLLPNIATACAARQAPGSPILATTPSTSQGLHPISYNGSFFHETVYRQDASPAVDAAWSALGVDYRAAHIPSSLGAAAGLTKDHVQVSEKYGGGWPANVEGLHHLHCLNLLRQALPWNYKYYESRGEGAFKNDEGVVKMHVTHCLDILRQQLMCTVDTGVLGQVWWGTPAAPKPFVDFNTVHQCKDFDAVRRWAEERQLPATPPVDFLRAPQGRIAAEIP